MWRSNGRSEIFPGAVCQKKKNNKKSLNTALKSGANLSVSRGGETFGFMSLVPDTVKVLASF